LPSRGADIGWSFEKRALHWSQMYSYTGIVDLDEDGPPQSWTAALLRYTLRRWPLRVLPVHGGSPSSRRRSGPKTLWNRRAIRAETIGCGLSIAAAPGGAAMAFVWSNALSVGVPEIDGQHQELINRTNQMLAAMKEGRGRQEVEKLLDFLGEYVVEHFAAEERRMEAAGFPGLNDQKKMHKAFVLDFGRMSSDLRKGGVTSEAVIQVHRRVSEWLRVHIGQKDQEFGQFLRTRAQKAA
jgi:hemerythrin